jgi:hypothetical protein
MFSCIEMMTDLGVHYSLEEDTTLLLDAHESQQASRGQVAHVGVRSGRQSILFSFAREFFAQVGNENMMFLVSNSRY